MDASFAERIQMVSVQMFPFLMAVVFHEYAHGYVANRWGDTTAKDQGRLTLNPLPHLDPIGTILFPLINMLSGMNLLFGWARPVPIDPRRFRKYRPGLFWVSLAGPAMNVLLAIASAAVLCAMIKWLDKDFYFFDPFVLMAQVSVTLNFALAIFNLIPLPPLDGSKIVESFLSLQATRKYESLARYSFFILMAMMLTGAFSILRYPILFCSNLTLYAMSQLFHVGL